jgi:hypothetical protein
MSFTAPAGGMRPATLSRGPVRPGRYPVGSGPAPPGGIRQVPISSFQRGPIGVGGGGYPIGSGPAPPGGVRQVPGLQRGPMPRRMPAGQAVAMLAARLGQMQR